MRNLDIVLANIGTRKILDVSNLRLDDEAARKIGKLLSEKNSLKRVNIAWNDIWPDGARALALALSGNSSLEFLDMSHNNIQSEGAEHIANYLRVNSTLKTLNLSDNNIDDNGAKHLLAALDDNTSLQTLLIEGNPIHCIELRQKVAEKLKENRIPQKDKSAQKADLLENVTLSASQSDVNKLRCTLEEQQAQTNNLKKKLEKVTNESNAAKARLAAQGAENANLKGQLDSYLKQCVEFERKVVLLAQMAERGKTKANEVSELTKSNEALHAELQAANQRVNILTSERRTLRQENSSLTKRVATVYGASEECELLDFPALATLEGELEVALRAVRQIRVQKLQRKVDEVVDSKKCKVCFEGPVESVLMPCGHHILCQACSHKIVKCPVCNTIVQTRIRTYEC